MRTINLNLKRLPSFGGSLFLLFFLFLISTSCNSNRYDQISGAREVISNVIGERADEITLILIEQSEGKDQFSINAKDGQLTIEASSGNALCYAFNRYLKLSCHSMVGWGGKNIELPQVLPDYNEKGISPYEFRYFLNVCTFGYTTPYWDWNRWSKELDMMALRGVNMPLASVASEAIARRVWVKMGLSEEEADNFFTGAAHLPWHRMGNLNTFDGPLAADWHQNQIELQHKILQKMRQLGMNPVAPAFAGFVPPAFLNKHPEIKYNQLVWGGFDTKYNACVLAPDSPYFEKIGALFVKEWEAEFGKAQYYLSDSFNEMKLPVAKDDTIGKHNILASYGEAIYNSIASGDKDAVWVTQGWTFGYQHDFWDSESLQALLSKVPDDKMIIVDLGNDYPKWIWHTEQTWKVHNGFYGKGWIFSYVPNFGGKVLPTGDLNMYASSSSEALHSPVAGYLRGFGSAPEGIENNEVIYELLSDMGWTDASIDLDSWIKDFCIARYGSFDKTMEEAWNYFRSSVYGSLVSYPRFTWQTVVPDKRRNSRHSINDDFGKGVELFLSCEDLCNKSQLYRNDAIEFSAIWMGEKADRHYAKALAYLEKGKKRLAEKELDNTITLLYQVDSLLSFHPLLNLSSWIDYAANSTSISEKSKSLQSNAKRLITTWGGFQEDYAARLWSGLIKDYYIPRLEIYFSNGREGLDLWEEKWIQSDSNTNETY